MSDTASSPASPAPASPAPASPAPASPARASLRSDLRDAYRQELDAGHRSALLSWLAFTGVFAAVRGITYSIRAGRGPFRNLSAGGEHLHHYLWGIGLLTGVGAIAVRGEDRHRRHPVVAVSYGAGLALIVDEFALLLDLKDVYWAKQGRISVDLGVSGSALTGSFLAARPVLQAVVRKRGRVPASWRKRGNLIRRPAVRS